MRKTPKQSRRRQLTTFTRGSYPEEEGDIFPMDCANNNETSADFQPPGIAELSRILDGVDAGLLLDRLRSYRRVGRKGYPLAALWRAYLASFALNLPSANALIRRLEDDSELRILCGFSAKLPHRTTFNRFISRLSHHRDLVEDRLRSLTDQLASQLPGFGEKVAVDSTVVYTHSNPNRKVVSDPEASWTKKHSAKGKDREDEWHFGYKHHLVADANYGLPIAGFTTTAKRNDSPELPSLLEKAESAHQWFAPQYVMADKGYDSIKNYKTVLAKNAIPIIAIRDMSKGKLREGIYTNDGTPTCMGEVPMEWVASDPERGHLYRCAAGGCHLKSRRGFSHCRYQFWEKRDDNPRVFGPIRRGSREWKALYKMRWSVERVFKSMKESRRLESHCVRGLRKVSLHAAMSALAFQATALERLISGDIESLRWMVRKVA